RLSDRPGRWHLPAQPLPQRRKRHRGRTPPGLRGHDARAKIIDAYPRALPSHLRQRAADARFPALALPGRNSQRTGGYRAWFDGRNRRIAPLRARSRVFLFLRGISAPRSRITRAEGARITAACRIRKFLQPVRDKTRWKSRPAPGPEGAPSGIWRGYGGRRGRRRRRSPNFGEFPRTRHKKVHRTLRPFAASVVPSQPIRLLSFAPVAQSLP